MPSSAKQLQAAPRDLDVVAVGLDPAPLLEAFVDEHAKFARQMVVADARLAQRRLARTGTHANRAGTIGDAHEAFQQMRDVAVRQPEIAVATLALHGEQPAHRRASPDAR